jgi:hypothetical protein
MLSLTSATVIHTKSLYRIGVTVIHMDDGSCFLFLSNLPKSILTSHDMTHGNCYLKFIIYIHRREPLLFAVYGIMYPFVPPDQICSDTCTHTLNCK